MILKAVSIHPPPPSEGPGGRGGRRRGRHEHAGPPGRVLRRVPSPLHALPEDLRTTGGAQRVALPLPRLQGGLQGHHALQLVGRSHPGPGVEALQQQQQQGGRQVGCVAERHQTTLSHYECMKQNLERASPDK